MDVITLTNEAKVTALVSQRPPSYTNDTLRTTYPSLLQHPSHILKEFLDFNEMALGLYGATLASDTYGMLRLGPFVRATRTTSLIARHLNSKFK